MVDENPIVDEIVPPNCQPLAPKGRAHQPTHMMFEADDLNLDGSVATGAIIFHLVPPGVKFTITSTMVQLLNLKYLFEGTTGDDANQHLMNFMAICKPRIFLWRVRKH